MTEVKGVRRRIQFLDDLRNRKRYWKLKEAEDQKKMETTVYQSNISIFHKSRDLQTSSIIIIIIIIIIIMTSKRETNYF